VSVNIGATSNSYTKNKKKREKNKKNKKKQLEAVSTTGRIEKLKNTTGHHKRYTKRQTCCCIL
tara:strand:- start:560 stop:748 length:189 start_codon:yes stop_codon:yes gene_type:complete